MPLTSSSSVRCSNITKQFGTFFALGNISVDIPWRAIVGIAGANGAGKTTLLKIMSGLMVPSSGKVLIDDLDYEDHRVSIYRKLGVVLDEMMLHEELTTRENLAFFQNLHGIFNKKKINEHIIDFTQEFGLSKWIDEPVRTLSRGMKKKADIIRAMLHKPRIIIMDEPFASLDPSTVLKLAELLKTTRERDGTTVIFTIHDMNLAKQICDLILVMRQGKIMKQIARQEFVSTDIAALL